MVNRYIEAIRQFFKIPLLTEYSTHTAHSGVIRGWRNSNRGHSKG